jgi:hypothetical protein
MSSAPPRGLNGMSIESDRYERELARRRSGGVQVTLRWDSVTNAVFVDVESAGAQLRIAVDPADALEAYEHPHAYRARRQVRERVRRCSVPLTP